MGSDFANNLFEGLNSIFKNFGKEKITKGHHMEKLCLISPHVGRDKISDFTTNFAKQVEVYKAASETNRAIKVILYFSEKEYEKLCIILNDLGLAKCEDIILIDARDDNKESASNVKITAQSISGCQSQGDFKY